MINNKIIVGTMLVSQCADILDFTIPDLLKRCDWCLIVMDNQSQEVEEKIYRYQVNNYNKLFVRHSSLPDKLFSRSGKLLTYHERWKAGKGVIRNDVFVNLKCILDWKKPGYNKIDILLWPDHDIVFTDCLSELLIEFIASNYKAISMKHVSVFGDMNTAIEDNMGHHVHIMKYDERLVGLPRRFYALYHPLKDEDVMYVEYYSVHLAYATEVNRQWRKKQWKTENLAIKKLYNLPKTVVMMKPEEIKQILK